MIGSLENLHQIVKELFRQGSKKFVILVQIGILEDSRGFRKLPTTLITEISNNWYLCLVKSIVIFSIVMKISLNIIVKN